VVVRVVMMMVVMVMIMTVVRIDHNHLTLRSFSEG